MKRLILFTFLFISFSVYAQSPVPPGAKAEKVADGFGFVEGPVWNDSLGLLFSDMNNNVINNYTREGDIKVFLKPSNVSNGLTYDRQGRLLITQTGLRRVVRLERDGSQTVLASDYEGKRLNSPNDIVCKSDGSIFFTDPPFNIPTGQHQELSFSGIYRISPKTGELQLLDKSLQYPNGICFSPDEKKLYVNDSQVRIIYVWDVINDTAISGKRIFASMKPQGYADGMKTDAGGNLFSAGPLGIWVFSPDGTVLDTIAVPEQTTNCNWGDPDGKTLYITASTGLYKVRLGTETGIKRQGYIPEKTFELFANYPNPFNPTTVIPFNVYKAQYLKLKIYDLEGNELSTLMNSYLLPGKHEVSFNASGFSSGTYFYTLAGTGGIQTGKFVLLK